MMKALVYDAPGRIEWTAPRNPPLPARGDVGGVRRVRRRLLDRCPEGGAHAFMIPATPSLVRQTVGWTVGCTERNPHHPCRAERGTMTVLSRRWMRGLRSRAVNELAVGSSWARSRTARPPTFSRGWYGGGSARTPSAARSTRAGNLRARATGWVAGGGQRTPLLPRHPVG